MSIAFEFCEQVYLGASEVELDLDFGWFERLALLEGSEVTLLDRFVEEILRQFMS